MRKGARNVFEQQSVALFQPVVACRPTVILLHLLLHSREVQALELLEQVRTNLERIADQ